MEKENIDHDILIRLEEKVERLIKDVSNMKDGVYRKIDNIEIKVNNLQSDHVLLSHKEIKKKIEQCNMFIEEFKTTIRDLKYLIGIAGVMGAIIAYVTRFIFDFIKK